MSWISIQDQMPQPWDIGLVYSKEHGIKFAELVCTPNIDPYFREIDYDFHGVYMSDITHWIPLKSIKDPG